MTKLRHLLRCWPVAVVLAAVTVQPQGASGAAASANAPAAGLVQWDGVQRVVAFGDVHGAFPELQQLLRDAQVIDAQGHWAAGASHVVSLGDLLDRGPGARQVMDLLMQLQDESRAAGGQLHVLLGNHEVMNLLGDLRYVSAEEYASFADLEGATERETARRAWRDGNCAAPCAEFDTRFPVGYFGRLAAFGPQGRYGKWLLAGPVQGMDLTQLDLRYRTVLVEYMGLVQQLLQARLLGLEDDFADRARLARSRLQALSGTAAGTAAAPSLVDAVRRFERVDRDPLLSEEGPNWYRGYALCKEVVEADLLTPALRRFGAARLVIGHTPTRDSRVVSRFDGRVIKVDTGMNRAAYRGTGAALVLLPSEMSVRYTDRPQPEPVMPEGLFVAPNQLADSVVQQALTSNPLTAGGSRTADEQQVTVSSEGRAIPAVFQTRDRDAVRRELAALRLDRLLGLGLVPATAGRELNGRQGLVQARPRRSLTQAEMRPGAISSPWCSAEPQFQLMYALDTLTGNERRTPASILYDAENGMVLATSFGSAFGTGKGLPAWLRARPPTPGAELRRRLASLDAASLASALGDLLDEPARRAVLARRDALLALPAAAQR